MKRSKNNGHNQDTVSRLQNLESSMKLLEEEVKKISQIDSFIETKHITRQDEVWGCEKCGSRLGIYDRENDELRIRYRDFFAWWKPGIDGRLKIVCRGCSHINVVRYTNEGTSL
tara:strand:+ start:1271 stop:1612 length:342 start_codon:yes stop_codon:yes gene_type:complete